MTGLPRGAVSVSAVGCHGAQRKVQPEDVEVAGENAPSSDVPGALGTSSCGTNRHARLTWPQLCAAFRSAPLSAQGAFRTPKYSEPYCPN